MTRLMKEIGPMNDAAPVFPLATDAIDPVRHEFEAKGKDDLSLLWSGEAASLARWEDAEVLTRQLWKDAQSRLVERKLGGLPPTAITSGAGLTTIAKGFHRTFRKHAALS
jgi:hypothetical protein